MGGIFRHVYNNCCILRERGREIEREREQRENREQRRGGRGEREIFQICGASLAQDRPKVGARLAVL